MKTTTKKPKKNKTVQQRNNAYEKATPAQRRVMIAKDALAQVSKGKFKPIAGIWTDVRRGGEEPAGFRPLQPILLSTDCDVACSCCGVGSLFLSYVRLNNNAKYSDGWGFYDIVEKTGWPVENLHIIEIAFEVGRGRTKCIAENNERAAMVFGLRYDNQTHRLEAILRNIITNKGTFKP